MGVSAVQKANNHLSDGRPFRDSGLTVNQRQVFDIHKSGVFDPKTEGISKVKDADDAINVSKIYRAVMENKWVRTDEYNVYHRNPKSPLGKEIIYIEDGVVYKKLIPDVPVKVNGKEISLQKAIGMAVYDSTGLLKIEQTDEKMFTVSAIDLSAIAGKVRIVDFMRNGWALTDETGLPIASKPSSPDNSDARCGAVRTDFEKKATGYHGSFGLCGVDFDFRRRLVNAGDVWSLASGVAYVGLESPFSNDETINQYLRSLTSVEREALLRNLQTFKE